MQRRHLLKLGIASAALLALAGGGASLFRPGLQAGRLSEAARAIFAAAGRAILDGTLPAEEGPRRQAIEGMLQRIDALVGNLPAHAQGELSQLLALLASTPGRMTFAGLARSWGEASVEEIQQALQAMRTSRIALRQQAYHALHDIVGGTYFADPSTWSMLGYPGPIAL